MNNTINRNFKCKDEELPVICGFAAYSLKRDLADFTGFSPKFTTEFLSGFEQKTIGVAELVEPKSETAELKIITGRMHKTMDDLLSPINFLGGYIGMVKEPVMITLSDFGLTGLRKGIASRDAENVIKNLHIINLNIEKYNKVLSEQGLKVDITNRFIAAEKIITTDKQNQYQIISSRKNVVQNNVIVLNELYNQLFEIVRIGKILYKNVDQARVKEYTFSELKKQVRKTKSSKEKSNLISQPGQ